MDRVLDRVYDTFTNLERYYRRSKKSRKEYLLEKFGGDITIGSIIILDAIGAGHPETEKDIAKFSKIKTIFENIAKAASELDSISSFEFEFDQSISGKVLGLIDEVSTNRSYGKLVSQRELDRKYGALHYIVTPEGSISVPLDKCRFIGTYNGGMTFLVDQFYNNGGAIVEDGGIYERKQPTLVTRITAEALKRKLSSI